MVISSLMFGFIWDDVYPFCIFSFRGEDFVGRDVRPGSGPGPGPGPGSGSGLRGREASTIVVYGSEYKKRVEYCGNVGEFIFELGEKELVLYLIFMSKSGVFESQMEEALSVVINVRKQLLKERVLLGLGQTHGRVAFQGGG